METYDIENVKQPLHKLMRTYMTMGMQMMMFIRAVRTADWELHLVALEALTKYFLQGRIQTDLRDLQKSVNFFENKKKIKKNFYKNCKREK